MIRLYFIFTILAGGLPLQAQIQWHTGAEEATQMAAQSQRPLLMVFSGSDWCKPCMKLEQEVWNDPAFAAFADTTLVLLKVDFPRRKKNQPSDELASQNQELAETWNPMGIFPLVLLIDPEGILIGETGYRQGGADPYIQHLRQLIMAHESQH